VAFDLPASVAEELLHRQEVQQAARKGGFVLDRPQSLALDVDVSMRPPLMVGKGHYCRCALLNWVCPLVLEHLLSCWISQSLALDVDVRLFRGQLLLCPNNVLALILEHLLSCSVSHSARSWMWM
jgi:hypothetical protein